MTFVEKFENLCAEKRVSPSRALDMAGITRSAYTKWKKQRDIVPNGSTIMKLAEYFGCRYEDLAPGITPTDTKTKAYDYIVLAVSFLSEEDQKKLLRYIHFAYDELLPPQVQKMRL